MTETEGPDFTLTETTGRCNRCGCTSATAEESWQLISWAATHECKPSAANGQG